ncbi:MAG TPA: hypothetical protein VFT99_11975, partial [Roseiflexaceae bacterium]|nr:hypothetical protein [Roseiflexaceae bacterium]
LPVLGIVLALMLVLGGALAARGAAQSSDAVAPTLAATALPTGVTTPPGDDTLTGLATAAPAPAATNPFDTLRAALATGIEQGRAGDAGQELQAHLDAAQAAIEAEQPDQAAAELQAFLATLRANSAIDPAFASELGTQVEQLAASYQLALLPAEPPAQTTGDNVAPAAPDPGDKGKQGGNGKEDKGGKGKQDKGGKGKKDD